MIVHSDKKLTRSMLQIMVYANDSVRAHTVVQRKSHRDAYYPCYEVSWAIITHIG